MSTGKKILNVIGIIFAWILSLILIVTLYAAPVFMSALSSVKPDKLIDTLGDLEISQFIDSFEGIDADNEALVKFISTDAVQEIYEIYIGGLKGVFQDEPAENLLTEEKVKEIVHNHVDELYQILLEEEPDLALLPEAEAKQKVEEQFSEGLMELVAGLPSGEELRSQIMEENPELESAFEVFNQLDTIKMTYIIAIVVLSVLVFVCRLHGYRGFRWLAVDLFVATGFSALVCFALPLVPALIVPMLEGQTGLVQLAAEFLKAFTVGVYIRTGIMLLAGVGMLAIYLLIKKKLAQKKETVSAEAEPL